MNRQVRIAFWALLGATIVVAGRWWLNERADENDDVGTASDDSFPASDPPSFTPTAGGQVRADAAY